MGASYHPSIVPGSVMESVAGDGLAFMRDTVGTAASRVVSSNALPACLPSTYRYTRNMRTKRTLNTTPSFPLMAFMSDRLLLHGGSSRIDHGIDAWNEEQRKQGGNEQAAHDGTTERRIL